MSATHTAHTVAHFVTVTAFVAAFPFVFATHSAKGKLTDFLASVARAYTAGTAASAVSVYHPGAMAN